MGLAWAPMDCSASFSASICIMRVTLLQAQPHRRQTPLRNYFLRQNAVRIQAIWPFLYSRSWEVVLLKIDNSRPWARNLKSRSGKNGGDRRPTMRTAPARRSLREPGKAHLIFYAHHADVCSPARAWKISTHRTASATGPAPSAGLPEMKVVECANSSYRLSGKNMTRLGRVTIASYFGISELHIQQAQFLALSCLVSMGLKAASNLSPTNASSRSIHLPKKVSILSIVDKVTIASNRTQATLLEKLYAEGLSTEMCKAAMCLRQRSPSSKSV